jgi:hypothetical protein
MGHDIHGAAHIVTHTLPVTTKGFTIFLKTGFEIGNRDKGSTAYIKGGNKAVEKRPYSAVLRRPSIPGSLFSIYWGVAPLV